jgi:acetyl esterase/lipase
MAQHNISFMVMIAHGITRHMKRTVANLAVLLGAALSAFAQQKEIPIWPGVAPGSENWQQKEVQYLNARQQKMIRNVVKPTITVFLPDRAKATGTGVIVAPGGGFRFHSWWSEGTAVAEWLAERGVAAFVLKYRLIESPASEEEFAKWKPPSGGNVRELASEDGRQAMKVVRAHAADFGLDPNRIGIIGFSAGASVTTGVVMQHTAESKPNFAAPIYGGSTSGIAVPADAPPLFVLSANDDAGGSAASAKLFAEWKAAGRPVEIHVYSKGGHGFGMQKRGVPVDNWIDRFGEWLGAQGLLARKSETSASR